MDSVIPLDPAALRALRAARGLVSRLDVEEVLAELLEAARDATGARYAAIGVLDETRLQLERFVVSGIDAVQAAAIGREPRGFGVLGTVIRDPRPLRLDDVGGHPDARGFPPGHPPMRSFLGVPIVLDGAPWGNLYLTEKAGGPFDAHDEAVAVLLADWAGLAIANARAFARAEEHRRALEAAVGTLEVTTGVAQAVGAEVELDRVLPLLARRASELVGAGGLLLGLVAGPQLEIAVALGELSGAAGRSWDVDGSPLHPPLAHRRTGRLARGSADAARLGALVGTGRAPAALAAPLVAGGEALGLLLALDPREGSEFTGDDERLLQAFAASAATAVAVAHRVSAARIAAVLAAQEQERARWAAALHDGALQHLAAVGLELAVLMHEVPDLQSAQALNSIARRVTEQVDGLRELVSDLRPPALDDLGLGPALEGLAERTHRTTGLRVVADVEVVALSAELATQAFRVVQDALAGTARRGTARSATVSVQRDGDWLRVEIADDGARRLPADPDDLEHLRERVALLGGRVDVLAGPRGTMVLTALPLAA